MKSPENRTLALLACFGIIAAIAIGWSVTRATKAGYWKDLATEGKEGTAEITGFREIGGEAGERVPLRIYYSFKDASGQSRKGYTTVFLAVGDSPPAGSIAVTYHPRSPDVNAPVDRVDRTAATMARELHVAATVAGVIGAIALVILLGIIKVNVRPRSSKR